METIDAIAKHQECLLNPETTISEKYKTMFELKTIGTSAAQNGLINGYEGCRPSELLLHEICYTVG